MFLEDIARQTTLNFLPYLNVKQAKSREHEEGNVQISYDASGGEGVCLNRQNAVIWGTGVWPNRNTTFIVAKKAWI